VDGKADDENRRPVSRFRAADSHAAGIGGRTQIYHSGARHSRMPGDQDHRAYRRECARLSSNPNGADRLAKLTGEVPIGRLNLDSYAERLSAGEYVLLSLSGRSGTACELCQC
jgi:hypothetical protein